MKSSRVSPLSIINCLTWIFCLSMYTLELLCWYSQNSLIGFWLGLHWIDVSRSEKLISWQYWVCLPICLVLLKYILLEFCSCLQIHLVHTWLDLYLSIPFCVRANINSSMLLMSNSTWSLLVCRKEIEFYIKFVSNTLL